ncbi:hypothetical protein ACH5RR_032253 [Cinchona calisaya]|uniref:Uncharacterized protein n=1 Tax=Cinchona calisaya TaxID=153742 RepID=A0ABD2YHK7_9GENT
MFLQQGKATRDGVMTTPSLDAADETFLATDTDQKNASLISICCKECEDFDLAKSGQRFADQEETRLNIVNFRIGMIPKCMIGLLKSYLDYWNNVTVRLCIVASVGLLAGDKLLNSALMVDPQPPTAVNQQ